MHLPEYTDRSDFHIEADGTIVETHEHGYEGHELTSPRNGWELMQFTGLHDKNGKEIYDGDIVNCYDDNISHSGWEKKIILWNGGKCGFDFRGSMKDINYYAQFEVIGNIYETPELLNSKEVTNG